MFQNLHWTNILLLLLLALFIFGDKLPKMIGEGLRMLRNLRRMAQNATTDLSRELGTDIQLEDLHPKTFIRKHLISEADQEALVKPLRGISEDLARQGRTIGEGVQELGRETQGAATEVRRAATLTGSGSGSGSGTGRKSEPTTAPEPPAPRASLDDVT